MEKKLAIIFLVNLLINSFFLVLPEVKEEIVKEEVKEISLIVEENENKLQAGTVYVKDKVSASINNENKVEDVIKNTEELENVGTKYISYTLPVNPFYTEEKYQEVEVVDEVPPVIRLKGNQTMLISLHSDFVDPGYEAIDEYDGDITENVVKNGEVNSNKEGEYNIVYTLKDSSGNETSLKRKVIVKAEVTEEKEEDFKEQEYVNTITNSYFHSKGFSISFYTEEKDVNIVIDQTEIPVTKVQDHYYRFTVDLTNYENGIYNILLNEKELKDERDEIEKIVRAKIKDHLVTFSYSNNNVSFKIEDFSYEYDILIDAGHGGSDTGAINSQITEKQLNLEQTLYEKKRYEDHGLKVKLIRDDDTYGIMMGNEEWKDVTRRAYAVGYYGVVSKVVYSNHHNFLSKKSYSGYEVLVPSSLSLQELKEEFTIFNEWKNVYSLSENHIRFYARNYDTESIVDKENGNIYSFKDYYAINRIPLSLFKVKSVIYEGCYMSNEQDFKWYYEEENWKMLSEIKIKTYVESLGITYKEV